MPPTRSKTASRCRLGSDEWQPVKPKFIQPARLSQVMFSAWPCVTIDAGSDEIPDAGQDGAVDGAALGLEIRLLPARHPGHTRAARDHRDRVCAPLRDVRSLRAQILALLADIRPGSIATARAVQVAMAAMIRSSAKSVSTATSSRRVKPRCPRVMFTG